MNRDMYIYCYRSVESQCFRSIIIWKMTSLAVLQGHGPICSRLTSLFVFSFITSSLPIFFSRPCHRYLFRIDKKKMVILLFSTEKLKKIQLKQAYLCFKKRKYEKRRVCSLYLNFKHRTFFWSFNCSPIHFFDCIVQFLCAKINNMTRMIIKELALKNCKEEWGEVSRIELWEPIQAYKDHGKVTPR